MYDTKSIQRSDIPEVLITVCSVTLISRDIDITTYYLFWNIQNAVIAKGNV